MKNRIGFLILFIAMATTQAFAQKETKEAIVGSAWKYASVDQTKFNARKANGSVSAADQANSESLKTLLKDATITFNENNTFTISGATTQKGEYSIGYGNAMKFVVNGALTLFYVDKVTANELVIHIDNSSLLFTFKK